MAEKVKKIPSFFSLKRWNSQKLGDEPNTPKTPTTPHTDNPTYFKFSSPTVSSSRLNHVSEPRPRKYSAGGIRELVQCALCLEVLNNSKMLPCQHTFCSTCLTSYISGQNSINCPVCRTTIQILGPNFVSELPSNLYIESLLHLVGVNNNDSKSKTLSTPPATLSIDTPAQSVDLFAGGIRCSQCRTMCDNSDTSACQHCKMNFCRICWSQHLDDMQTQIGSILKQIDSATNRLEYKIENYKDRCEHLVEQIKVAVEEKINAIMASKEKLLQVTLDLQKSGDMTALALKQSLEEAKTAATRAMTNKEPSDDKDRVSIFINLHQNTLQLLSDISKWDTERFVFDKEAFRIELDASTPLEAELEEPLPGATKLKNPLENDSNLTSYYRSHNFVPHYVWRKTSRPCGVAVGPWKNDLYICGMDSHSVLVVERTQAKIVMRLSSDDMLCPTHVAFLKNLGEVYITDKWKHCVHVFSKNGDYLRSMGQKGSRLGMFRSPEGITTDNVHHLIYVVDTGNDRVQVLQPDGAVVDQYGVTTQEMVYTKEIWETKEVTCTEFSAPTSIAVTNDRVIILDSGNKRVKVYSKHDKAKIMEFGTMGQGKGQFRHPEVMTVDPLGFILVGDSGNRRVQVFKPNGQLVRVFGGFGSEPGKFGWVSGIHVTKELDVIISDSKNHTVNFY